MFLLTTKHFKRIAKQIKDKSSDIRHQILKSGDMVLYTKCVTEHAKLEEKY